MAVRLPAKRAIVVGSGITAVAFVRTMFTAWPESPEVKFQSVTFVISNPVWKMIGDITVAPTPVKLLHEKIALATLNELSRSLNSNEPNGAVLAVAVKENSMAPV